MKYLILALLLVTTLTPVGCTTAEKAQAKALITTTAKQVGKDLAIAAANTSVQLINTQIAAASDKLAAQALTLQAKPDPLKTAELQLQQSALVTASKLTAQLQAQLDKLKPVDTLPAAGTIVTPDPNAPQPLP